MRTRRPAASRPRAAAGRARAGGAIGPAIGAALLVAACGAGAGGPAPPPGAAVEIYAARDWYRERPEPEEDLRGLLATQPPPVGPAARSLLTHVLVGEQGRLPLYVAGVADRLEPFVGREVVVRGKRVDLSTEGFGVELWAGSIRLASPPPAR